MSSSNSRNLFFMILFILILWIAFTCSTFNDKINENIYMDLP